MVRFIVTAVVICEEARALIYYRACRIMFNFIVLPYIVLISVFSIQFLQNPDELAPKKDCEYEHTHRYSDYPETV